MYLIGYDLGSSSIKAALVDAESGKTISLVQYPDKEMEMIAHQAGWAEQDPEDWWANLQLVTQRLFESIDIDKSVIQGIGIGYQMHGLVVVDKEQKSLRPSIIWCDSRAVEIGNTAFSELGETVCLGRLMNSPGNFTASKLKWVKVNEPEIYGNIHKIMLPGDYLGMKMTGEIFTTISGLSEGMMWDFKEDKTASFLLDYYGIDERFIPEIVPSIGHQGKLTKIAADFLGLEEGIPITYRAGDQPNNAMSLNVLHPGEVAATGGTSGVVYGVVDHSVIDQKTRVNGFAHINYTKETPRIGVLLCINGAGIQYSWMRDMLSKEDITYEEIESSISAVEIGSEGLKILPFGNGAERMLNNKNMGCQILNLDFNIHNREHLYRAALEGIAYSFVYGIEVMKEMGLKIEVLKVGNDNLFQSDVFSTTISSILGCEIKMMNATGAVGAAKAAGVATGIYSTIEKAFENEELVKVYKPAVNKSQYIEKYEAWVKELEIITKSK